MRFSWDPRKARTNSNKHGVDFIEAVTVLADAVAEVVDDAVHTDRSVIVGQSRAGRLLVVVFTESSENEVRIISARCPTGAERRRYEEGKT